MRVPDAIRSRRSIKRFTDRPVSREEIETLLSLATLAPNHRLTQPWRFYVLGPESRRAYGAVLAERKAKKAPNPVDAQTTREKVIEEHRAMPAMIAVAVRRNANPEIAEEDYGAAMMAVQNIALAAVATGLGTHIKTGAVMEEPTAREAVGVPPEERIVAILNLGVPVETPPPKPRTAAAEFTTWRP